MKDCVDGNFASQHSKGENALEYFLVPQYKNIKP